MAYFNYPILILFLLTMQSLHAETYQESIKCLTDTIYHEARGESLAGQKAVAMTVINRVKHPEFPDSICSVVYQPKQFSWTTQKLKIRNSEMYRKLTKLAHIMYSNYYIHQIVDDAMKKYKSVTFFQISKRMRNKRLEYIGKIGNHNFWKIRT
jgi:spore germination cell wall hydrolase CwlJ-like protein